MSAVFPGAIVVIVVSLFIMDFPYSHCYCYCCYCSSFSPKLMDLIALFVWLFIARESWWTFGKYAYQKLELDKFFLFDIVWKGFWQRNVAGKNGTALLKSLDWHWRCYCRYYYYIGICGYLAVIRNELPLAKMVTIHSLDR